VREVWWEGGLGDVFARVGKHTIGHVSSSGPSRLGEG